MTPAVDHPAAAHDAVAPVGVRAAVVPTVIGRTEADRETRGEAPAEPTRAPTAVAAPATMPAATMPSGLGGPGQGRCGCPNGNDRYGCHGNPSK